MIERTENEFDIVERTNHRLVISNRELREQVSELEKMLIEQQDINKSHRQTPAVSIVMRSLQEKKKLYEALAKENTRLYRQYIDQDDPESAIIKSRIIEKQREIIALLEEIINQNFA